MQVSLQLPFNKGALNPNKTKVVFIGHWTQHGPHGIASGEITVMLSLLSTENVKIIIENIVILIIMDLSKKNKTKLQFKAGLQSLQKGIGLKLQLA